MGRILNKCAPKTAEPRITLYRRMAMFIGLRLNETDVVL